MRAHPARDESRRLRFAPALALVSALLLGNTARAEDKVTVTWHRKPYSPTTLPAIAWERYWPGVCTRARSACGCI